jgi:hypothetical protein
MTAQTQKQSLRNTAEVFSGMAEVPFCPVKAGRLRFLKIYLST